MTTRDITIIAATLTLAAAASSFADLNSVRLEEVPFGPAGTITCRAIANFSNPNDAIGAVFGSSARPLSWSTPSLGGLVNQNGGVAPDISHNTNGPYDSWFAMGILNHPNPEVTFDPVGPGCCAPCPIHLPDGCTGFDNFSEAYFTAPPKLVSIIDPAGNAADGWDVVIAQFTVTDEGFAAPMSYAGNITYLDANGNGITEEFEATECVSPCPEDLDGDGFITVSDLLIVLGNWGCTDPPDDCPGDVNGDGIVDIVDMLMILARWGACFPV